MEDCEYCGVPCPTNKLTIDEDGFRVCKKCEKIFSYIPELLDMWDKQEIKEKFKDYSPN